MYCILYGTVLEPGLKIHKRHEKRMRVVIMVAGILSVHDDRKADITF